MSLLKRVKDGYRVDYILVESSLKFIEQGITYEDLTEKEKAEYENLFEYENDEVPDKISSSALNEWIFNRDTIHQALNILMSDGIKIEYGEKIGKTIIFAKNIIMRKRYLRCLTVNIRILTALPR